MYSIYDLKGKKPEMVCKASVVRTVLVVFFSAILLAVAWCAVVYRKIPLVIVIGTSVGLVPVILIALLQLLAQRALRQWIVLITATEVIVRINKSSNIPKHSTIAIGVSLDALEKIEVRTETQVVKYGRQDGDWSEDWRTEHSTFLDLTTAFDLSTELRDLPVGNVSMGIPGNWIVSIAGKTIRVLWSSPSFRIKPDLDSVIKRLKNCQR